MTNLLRKIFPAFFLLLTCLAPAQNINCEFAHPVCNGETNTFPYSGHGWVNDSTLFNIEYACLYNLANANWYYLDVQSAGDIDLHITRLDEDGNPVNIDFACFGPLAASLGFDCPRFHTDDAPIIDCSASSSLEEDCHIPNAFPLQRYVIVVESDDTSAGTISFTQTGGAGVMDCDYECNIAAIIAEPGPCSPGINQYDAEIWLYFGSTATVGVITFTSSCSVDTFHVGTTTDWSHFIFPGLPANGEECTVNISFSGHPECDTFVTYTAPSPCPFPCEMVLTTDVIPPDCSLDQTTYSIAGTVENYFAPTTGTLTVSASCGATQVFSPPFASMINYNLTGLIADGTKCTVTAVFSDEPLCAQEFVLISPIACPCTIDEMTLSRGPCDGITNTYAAMVDLAFSAPPSTGTLNVTVCGSTQTFLPPFVSPMTVIFPGLIPATGTCEVSAVFSEDPLCMQSTSFDQGITITTTNVTCNGENSGTITINSIFGGTYSIDGGGVFFASNVFTGLAAGTYNVVVQTPEGCQAIGTAVVNEMDLVIPNASTITNESCTGACNGQVTVNPTGGTPPYTVTWSGPVSGSEETLYTACAGNYNVLVTDANGCTGTGSTVVTKAPPLPVTFEADVNEGCAPLAVQFTNTMDPKIITSCAWSFGDGTGSNDCDPMQVFTQPGCYDISLEIGTNSGCAFDTILSSFICVIVNPEAGFTYLPSVADVFDPTVQFTNTSAGGTTNLWDFGGTGTSSDVHPVHVFPRDSGGVYNVCLITISNDGCVDSACHEVNIKDIFQVYVPNAFTPDGDGLNDIFQPILQGIDPVMYEFYVFNRLGDIVYQSGNKYHGWNGTHKGMIAKEDVYVWKIKVKKESGAEIVEYTGHVTLLK